MPTPPGLTLRQMQSRDRSVRRAALEAMLQSDHAEFADALVAALDDLSNYDAAGRREMEGRIKDRIKKLGQAGFDALSRAMAGTNRKSRLTAITVLGDNAESRAVQPLIRAVEENRDVGPALSALAKIGTPEAVDFVIKTAKGPNPELRRTAIWALGTARTPRATELLLSI
jgi:HEAT repeat protein